jgi:putative SOS response-associated peptidase YedK
MAVSQPPPPSGRAPWAKDERIAFKMINARTETLTEKPAYRSLIGKYRCLVIADGFYDWTVGPDGKKQPIHFRLTETYSRI